MPKSSKAKVLCHGVGHNAVLVYAEASSIKEFASVSLDFDV